MDANSSSSSSPSNATQELLYASATAWPFFVYMSVALVAFVGQIFITCKRAANAGFVLMPILLLFLAFEFLIIGLDAEVLEDGATGSPAALAGFRMGRFFIASLVVPLTLICAFEIAYEVHKWQAKKFCCIIRFRDQHRRNSSWWDHFSRYSVWIICALLAMLALVANAPAIREPDEPTRADRFLSGRLPYKEVFQRAPFTLDDFADLVPELLHCSLMLYVGAALWSYGTNVAIEIVNTSITLWGALLLAAGFHTASWLATPSDWVAPYLVGGSRLALALALCISSWLVDRELLEFDRLRAVITRDGQEKKDRLDKLPARFVRKQRLQHEEWEEAGGRGARSGKAGAAHGGRGASGRTGAQRTAYTGQDQGSEEGGLGPVRGKLSAVREEEAGELGEAGTGTSSGEGRVQAGWGSSPDAPEPLEIVRRAVGPDGLDVSIVSTPPPSPRVKGRGRSRSKSRPRGQGDKRLPSQRQAHMSPLALAAAASPPAELELPHARRPFEQNGQGAGAMANGRVRHGPSSLPQTRRGGSPAQEFAGANPMVVGGAGGGSRASAPRASSGAKGRTVGQQQYQGGGDPGLGFARGAGSGPQLGAGRGRRVQAGRPGQQ